MKLLLASFVVLLLDVDASFHSTYKQAVIMYEGGLWSDASVLFVSARDQYQDWRQSFSTCKQRCGDEAYPKTWIPGSLTDLMKKSACSRLCNAGIENPLEASYPFRSRQLYHYLQYAYFKEGKLGDAVAAAHTFLEANPNDPVMLRNMKFYNMQPGYSSDDLVSKEPDHFLSHFIQAVSLYEEGLYDKAKDGFERALKGYYEAVELCLLMCGSSVNTSRITGGDMWAVFVEMYKSILKCRIRCPIYMSYATPYAEAEDYEAVHYHYLQFCYYQLNQLKEAVAATMTYVELKPDDPVMNQNLEYYHAQSSLSENDFTPRKEIDHSRSLNAEMEILRIGGVTVSTTVEGPPRTGSLDAAGISSIHTQRVQSSLPHHKIEQASRKQETIKQALSKQGTIPAFREDSYHASLSNWTIDYIASSSGTKQVEDNVEVLLPPANQEAKERVVAQHMASEAECQMLIALAKAGATPGDGYGKNPNPHTKFETFQGLHILNAAELARDGKLDPQGTHLYYDLTEKARAFTETYFHLKSTLYFSYTHLVCRTSLPSKGGREVNELSHPVHSDNCLIRGNGSVCDRVPPAYTTRDYSGVLYLNDDFEGGDFFWAHRNLSIDTIVRPACGRLVAFSAGEYHGVTGITSGTRCAVALWFTLDPEDNEPARQQAQAILSEMPKSSIENGDSVYYS
jgi:leucine proline-enriched proteoglycan (leprecan)